MIFLCGRLSDFFVEVACCFVERLDDFFLCGKLHDFFFGVVA